MVQRSEYYAHHKTAFPGRLFHDYCLEEGILAAQVKHHCAVAVHHNVSPLYPQSNVHRPPQFIAALDVVLQSRGKILPTETRRRCGEEAGIGPEDGAGVAAVCDYSLYETR
jgi:hypothetical protein